MSKVYRWKSPDRTAEIIIFLRALISGAVHRLSRNYMSSLNSIQLCSWSTRRCFPQFLLFVLVTSDHSPAYGILLSQYANGNDLHSSTAPYESLKSRSGCAAVNNFELLYIQKKFRSPQRGWYTIPLHQPSFPNSFVHARTQHHGTFNKYSD